MSKYIKLEDAINAIEDKIAEYIPTLYGRYAEIPLELRMAIEHLPTIEVSEDCISREYLEEQLQQIEDITAMAHIDLGEDPYDETEEITMPISTVRKIFKNAPSVVPTAEQSSMVGEWIKEFSGNGWNDYWDYTCSNCGKKYKRGDSILYNSSYCPNCGSKMKDASSVVPSRAEGEWIDDPKNNEIKYCSNCEL